MATFRAALLRSAAMDRPFAVTVEDLHCKVRQRQQQALIVFLVDASESMASGAEIRVKAARGAVLGLLAGAYQRRDQVALVVFRGERAEVLLHPTSSVELARQRLRRLPIGGATPFADGLQQAHQLIDNSRRRQAGLIPTLVIVTDGEANVPLRPGSALLPELDAVATELSRLPLSTIIVDTSSAIGGSRTLQRLAGILGGSYQRIHDLHAGRLYEIIRKAADVSPSGV